MNVHNTYQYAWMCINMYQCAWMCINTYQCAWMCINMYQCAWMCINMYQCAWMSAQGTGVLRTCLWSRAILDFLGLEFWGSSVHLKKPTAKLVKVVSEKERETGILGASLWRRATPYFFFGPKTMRNQDFKDCLWSLPILDFLWSWASACPIWDWTQTYKSVYKCARMCIDTCMQLCRWQIFAIQTHLHFSFNESWIIKNGYIIGLQNNILTLCRPMKYQIKQVIFT